MQLYGLIGELGSEKQISLRFTEFTVANLATGSAFSDILAANAGKVVQAKDSQSGESYSYTSQSGRDLGDAVYERAERLYEEPDQVILDSDKEDDVRGFLEKLGFDEEEVEEALEDSRDEATGGIRMDKLLKAVKIHLQGQGLDGTLSLPAGSTPEILSLAEKLGLNTEGLEDLADTLGSGALSLTEVVTALKEAGAATGSLSEDDLEGVKDLLMEAGLSEEKALSLLERYVDSEGALSMDGLIAMLEDVIQENDKVANLINSGKLTTILAGLMEGAKVEVESQPEVALNTEGMLNQLNRLEADQKRELNAKKNAENSSSLFNAEGEESEDGTGLTLKSLESLLSKSDGATTSTSTAADTTDGSAMAKISAKVMAHVEMDIVGIKQMPGKGANASQDTEKAALTAKAAVVKAGSEVLQTQTTSPERGADQVNLSTTTTQTSQIQGTGTAAKTGQTARMSPSVLLDQLNGRMTVMLKNGQSSVKLQLHPQELGSLKIDLKVDGASVRATIVAENHQVQQILGSNSSELKQSLADQGFNLDKFEVITQSEYQQANSDGQENKNADQSQQGYSTGTAAGLEEDVSISEEYPASTVKYYRAGQLDLLA